MLRFKQFLKTNKLVSGNLFLGVHGLHARVGDQIKEDSNSSYIDYASSEYKRTKPMEGYKELSGSQHDSIQNHPDRDTLKGYTKSSYPLNKALFDKETTGKKLSKKHQTASEGLDKIIGDHTLPKKMTVYHGAGFDPRKIHHNGVIRSPGYLSTTNNPESVQHHARMINNETGESHQSEYDPQMGGYPLPGPGHFTRHVIQIEVPAGTNAVAPGQHSKHPFENEILFGRNRNLRLTGQTHEFKVDRPNENGSLTTVVHHATLG
jgi:hypothetical protein